MKERLIKPKVFNGEPIDLELVSKDSEQQCV